MPVSFIYSKNREGPAKTLMGVQLILICMINNMTIIVHCYFYIAFASDEVALVRNLFNRSFTKTSIGGCNSIFVYYCYYYHYNTTTTLQLLIITTSGFWLLIFPSRVGGLLRLGSCNASGPTPTVIITTTYNNIITIILLIIIPLLIKNNHYHH